MSTIHLVFVYLCVIQDQDHVVHFKSLYAVLGATLNIRRVLFKIVEIDLRTYNFMKENNDMFTQDAIDGAKRDLESKGFLNPLEEENDNKSNQKESSEDC